MWRKGNSIWAAVIVCLIVGLWLVKLNAPSGWPQLLQRATRIINLRVVAWLQTPPPTTHERPILQPILEQYHWKSSQVLLLGGLLDNGHCHNPYRQYNIETRAVTPLAPFDQLTQKYNFVDGDCPISPDGRQILAANQDGVATIASLNGSALWQRRLSPDRFWTSASNAVWLPDSRRWVQLMAKAGSSYNLYAVEESLDLPGVVRQIPIGLPIGTASGFDLMQTHLLGSMSSGRMLATISDADSYDTPGFYRKINFFDFGIDGPSTHVRQYTISLPKLGQGNNSVALSQLEDVELSPGGDRLAWLVHSTVPPSRLRQWLARWIPPLRAAPRPFIELRTSRLDGSDIHVIGDLTSRDNLPQGQGPDAPYALQWLPDGQRLSFVYQGALWTVPAK